MKTDVEIQYRLSKLEHEYSISFEDSEFKFFEYYIENQERLESEINTLKWVLDPQSFCIAVTCLPCATPFPQKEAPYGCASCGMLEWLNAFSSEEECNIAYREQYPEEFGGNGKHLDLKKYIDNE